MEKPIVTIMIPTYNHQGTLGRCLQSAVDQDYENVRIAAMDNKSDDGSYDVILDFEKRYRDRVYTGRLFSQVSQWDHWGRCFSITNPRTRYIYHLQPTHVLAPSFISRAIERFESNENLGCVLVQADVLHPTGQATDAPPLFPEGCTIPGDVMMESLMRSGLDIPAEPVYRRETYLLAHHEGLIFNRFPRWLPLLMASSISDFGYIREPLARQGDPKSVQGRSHVPSLEAFFEHYLFLQSFCTIAARLKREAIGRQFPAALRHLSLDCVRCARVLLEQDSAPAAKTYLSLSQAFLPEIAETPEFAAVASSFPDLPR
jgi:hypothetical protein